MREETAYARQEAAELRRRSDRAEGARLHRREQDGVAAAERALEDAHAQVRQLQDDLDLRRQEVDRLRQEVAQQNTVGREEQVSQAQASRELAAERRALQDEREVCRNEARGGGSEI